MINGRPALVTALAVVLAVSAFSFAGCGDDEDEGGDLVLAETKRITGFYVAESEGGHLSILVDRYAARSGPGLATVARPTAPLPPTVRATMVPDDGSGPHALTGHDADGTLTFSGDGYQFVVPTNGYTAALSGTYTGPHGVGYVRAHVDSSESVRVYLGTFSGDLFAGRWSFVSSDSTFDGTAVDTTGSQFTFEGSMAPAGSDFDVQLIGLGPSNYTLVGFGTMDGTRTSSSGEWTVWPHDGGPWSANRFVPGVLSSPGRRPQ